MLLNQSLVVVYSKPQGDPITKKAQKVKNSVVSELVVHAWDFCEHRVLHS
jgi:hypothetical protein